MKCVNCGVDNNLKERTANQGRCKNCNHTFAFEPTSMDAKYKFTDPFFQKIITDISVNNTLSFTPKQFFYALDKRMGKKNNQWNGWKILGLFLIFPVTATFITGISLIVGLGIILINSYLQSKSPENKISIRKNNAKFIQISGIVILILGILLSLSFNSFPLFASSVIFGILLIYLGTTQINSLVDAAEIFKINKNLFETWLNRWQQINGKITNMLPPPRQQNTPATINPDITAYSFDRVVVCDSAEVAQFLIANNFHFEKNCAVLSVTGYPEDIFSTVMEMLRRNSDLKVYALHDASPRGVSLVNHLRTSPNWFLNTDVTIYDLGLPRQLMNDSQVFIQSSEESIEDAKKLSVDVKRDLTEAEMVWLVSGKYVELESFTPQKLLRFVNQGIAKSIQPNISSNNLIGIDDNYNSGSNITMFAVDTFG
ncbi:MAG: hypothetical protein IGS23_21430 [Rivularia sp. T60_A2020_040]|nr:hypothetical protein [Rivularia sp. T60_A2020_040]